MSNAAPLPALTVLLDGLAFVESPRWHDGRMWFARWGTGEVVGRGPAGLGWTFDWLPDGRLLVTGQELLRREPDGTMVRHADLSGIYDGGWNDLVVDGRGNIYVTSIRCAYLAGAPPTSGIIALVTPDGAARVVADGLAFPNGMVVTPDNRTLVVGESFAGRLIAFDIAADGSLANRRVWAEGLLPDGICLDAEGAIWVGSAPVGEVLRVREGGEVLARLEHGRATFGTMLGGPGRRTLFVLTVEWRGTEHVDEAVAARTGQVLMAADGASARIGHRSGRAVSPRVSTRAGAQPPTQARRCRRSAGRACPLTPPKEDACTH